MAKVFKIFGTVEKVYSPVQSKNDASKYIQEFIISSKDGDYDKEVGLTLFNKALTNDNVKHLVAGNQITCSFNVSTRVKETEDGVHYFNTTLSVWKIESGDTTSVEEIKRESNGEIVFAKASEEDVDNTF